MHSQENLRAIRRGHCSLAFAQVPAGNVPRQGRRIW